MGAHQLFDYILSIGLIAATVGGGVLSWLLNRRDKLQDKVEENREDIIDISRHLQERTGYRPLVR